MAAPDMHFFEHRGRKVLGTHFVDPDIGQICAGKIRVSRSQNDFPVFLRENLRDGEVPEFVWG